MKTTFLTKVWINLVVSYDKSSVFLFIFLFWMCSAHWFEVGHTALENGNVMLIYVAGPLSIKLIKLHPLSPDGAEC